jgi:hypothetical protein
LRVAMRDSGEQRYQAQSAHQPRQHDEVTHKLIIAERLPI